MKIVLSFFLIFLSSVSLSKPNSDKTLSSSKTKEIVLFLGDSLTEGYQLSKRDSFPAIIEQKLRKDGLENITVVNAGISGATSANGLANLKWQLKAKQRPTFLVLALGANDGLRGLSVEEMKKNLKAIITYAKGEKLKILLVGIRIPPNYGPAYASTFDASFAEIAKEENIPLIPFLLEGVAANKTLNQSDGIHPNAKGNLIVADTVYKYLKPLLLK